MKLWGELQPKHYSPAQSLKGNFFSMFSLFPSLSFATASPHGRHRITAPPRNSDARCAKASLRRSATPCMSATPRMNIIAQQRHRAIAPLRKSATAQQSHRAERHRARNNATAQRCHCPTAPPRRSATVRGTAPLHEAPLPNSATAQERHSARNSATARKRHCSTAPSRRRATTHEHHRTMAPRRNIVTAQQRHRATAQQRHRIGDTTMREGGPGGANPMMNKSF
jgi:hypothetical protein